MNRATTHLPSWQSEPCPSWCTRDHRDGDHVEDRGHCDDGVVVPVVAAVVDRASLRRQAVADELVVQRVQGPGETRDWVVVMHSEGAATTWVLSPESARALGSALIDETAR